MVVVGGSGGTAAQRRDRLRTRLGAVRPPRSTAGGQDGPPPTPPGRRRRSTTAASWPVWPVWVDHCIVAGLALAAFGVSLAVSRLVFPHFSVNNDEPVYAFQARLLLDHRLTLPASDATFFRPWMSGRVGDHLVMVFPPVLPALLALGQVLAGSMAVGLGVLAAAAVTLVHLLTRLLSGDRRAALVAPLVLAVCPLFVIQSGLFLSYVLALDLELGAAVLLVCGARHGRLRWFVAAGGVLGLLVFARPFDAVLTGVPLLLVGLVARSGGPSRVTARAASVLTGAAPGVLASLAYNARVTGNPFRLPLAATGGNDAAGFGRRQLAAGTPRVDYTIHQAVSATLRNLGSLPGWLPGGVVLLAVAGLGLYRLRASAWAWALTTVALTVPVGYAFYWGTLLIVRGRRTIGPHYYLALLIPIVVLGAAGLAELSRRGRLVAACLLCVLLATSWVSLDTRIRRNRQQVALHNREVALLHAAGVRNAVVILPSEPPDGAWLMHPRPSFMNDPDLRQSVLFATDHGGANFALVDQFPSRALYRQLARTPAGAPGAAPAPALWRLTPRSSARYRVHVHLRNHDGAPVVSVYLTDGRRRVRYVVDPASGPGRTYDVTWLVSPVAISLSGVASPPLERSLTDLDGFGTVAVGVSYGSTAGSTDASLDEARYWYRARDGGDTLDLMLPGEQWQYRPAGRPRWAGQDVGADFSVDVAPG